ncbi:MAG: putative porin [Deltaproteobacteria bacterium]|nr:putative porin [Deltaproteobacteria bacterium]
MKKRATVMGLAFLGALLVFWCQPAFCGTATADDVLKRLNDLSDIIQQQQQEIESLKLELKSQRKSIEKGQEVQKEEIKKAVKVETAESAKSWHDSLPKWTRKIKVSGDLRLRYERLWDRGMLNEDGTPGKQDARDRGRIRVRLYLDAPITDEIKTHFMITTNMATNQEATTTNATFGEDFNDKGIYLARAYAEYKPNWFKGLGLGAGKFKKNFYNTDIMWDPDVNPEGAFEYYKFMGSKIFQPFIYLSQMVANENNRTPDAMLYLNQAGFDWNVGPVKWVLAGSYYSWSNLNGTKWMHDGAYNKGGGNSFVTDPVTGNIGYEYGYKLWEAYSQVGFNLGPYPAIVYLDYIYNAADDVPSDENKAYNFSFKIGNEGKKGDYTLFYKYAYIEQNAVLGCLNDQDFYGTNRKGHKVALHYWPFGNTLLRAVFFYTDPVSDWKTGAEGNPLWNSDRYKEHENRLQMDVVFKF